MSQWKRLALMSSAALLLVPAAFAGPQRAGKWEITTQMEMPNMPVKMPANTTTMCVTDRDVDNPEKTLPKMQKGRDGKENPCKISDYKVDGNKVTWNMKCEGAHSMSGSGEILYSEDTYNGVFKINAEGQDMSIKYAGKRVGECDK